MPRRVAPSDRKSVGIAVRLHPKTMFGIELMRRLHKESVAEVVTRALEDAFWNDSGGLRIPIPGTDMSENLLEAVWAERPSDRVANLAFCHRQALTRTEEEIWKEVEKAKKYWSTDQKDAPSSRSKETLQWDVLAEDWEKLRDAAIADRVPGNQRQNTRQLREFREKN